MLSQKRMASAVGLFAAAAMVLGACAPQATGTPQVIVQTQVVVQTSAPIVQTQIVNGTPQQVIVTATPAPVQPTAAATRYIVMVMPLSRRELIDLGIRAAALPGAAEFFSTWLKAAEHNHPLAPPQPPLFRDYKPAFFAPDDFAALRSFTEILIPTDDTPGAREAHCAHYIDFVMQASNEANPKLREQWRAAMAALKTAGFHAADAAGKEQLVEAMSKPERDRTATHPAYAAYRLIKQQNTFAFYTSRAGMIEALDYRGNSYNESFPGCTHPEHRVVR